METFSSGGVEQINDVLTDAFTDDGFFDDLNPFEDDVSDLSDEAGFMALGLGLLYLISKGKKSGMKAEAKKSEFIKEYEAKLKEQTPEARDVNEDDYSKLIENLKQLILLNEITQEESNKYLRQVEGGTMSLSTVLRITNRLINKVR